MDVMAHENLNRTNGIHSSTFMVIYSFHCISFVEANNTVTSNCMFSYTKITSSLWESYKHCMCWSTMQATVVPWMLVRLLVVHWHCSLLTKTTATTTTTKKNILGSIANALFYGAKVYMLYIIHYQITIRT